MSVPHSLSAACCRLVLSLTAFRTWHSKVQILSCLRLIQTWPLNLLWFNEASVERTLSKAVFTEAGLSSALGSSSSKSSMNAALLTRPSNEGPPFRLMLSYYPKCATSFCVFPIMRTEVLHQPMAWQKCKAPPLPMAQSTLFKVFLGSKQLSSK